MPMRKTTLQLATLALAALILAPAGAAFAQTYPAKPVRIIVPFPAGQATDTIARVVAEHLSKSLGQQFIVENKPGAGGAIGIEAAAKSPPDGYTLTTAPSGPFGINPSLYPKLPYDPVADFAAIINLVLTPQTLVANPGAGIGSVSELVAKARAKPGGIDYASLGNGTTSHLTMELFQSTAGVKLSHVPFKGSAEAQLTLLSGEIPLMSDAIPATLQHIKAGKLIGLGIASLQRSPFLPDLPTLAEQGYPGFEAVGWIGLAAPARTPEPILDRLNGEINRILGESDVKQRLAILAFTPVGGSRAEFAAFLKSEIAKWGKVVKESGAKID
jgi:tripartite-type tricarboxylate transporter receptor subunit TctC